MRMWVCVRCGIHPIEVWWVFEMFLEGGGGGCWDGVVGLGEGSICVG